MSPYASEEFRTLITYLYRSCNDVDEVYRQRRYGSQPRYTRYTSCNGHICKRQRQSLLADLTSSAPALSVFLPGLMWSTDKSMSCNKRPNRCRCDHIINISAKTLIASSLFPSYKPTMNSLVPPPSSFASLSASSSASASTSTSSSEEPFVKDICIEQYWKTPVGRFVGTRPNLQDCSGALVGHRNTLLQNIGLLKNAGSSKGQFVVWETCLNLHPARHKQDPFGASSMLCYL
jgi:hypothetical protein